MILILYLKGYLNNLTFLVCLSIDKKTAFIQKCSLFH